MTSTLLTDKPFLMSNVFFVDKVHSPLEIELFELYGIYNLLMSKLMLATNTNNNYFTTLSILFCMFLQILSNSSIVKVMDPSFNLFAKTVSKPVILIGLYFF